MKNSHIESQTTSDVIITSASYYSDLPVRSIKNKGIKLLRKYAEKGDEKAIAKLRELGLWKESKKKKK